jgi:OmpA-OmpF porin, OOP family
MLTDPRFAKAEVRLMGSELNSPGNDHVDAIAPDGSFMFISRTVNGGNSDVYYAIRQTEGWSNAQLLQGYINDSTNNFVGGIAASGDLIAVAKMGEIGFCRKIDGSWRQPMMAKIDSFYTDADFFNFALSPDGKMLVMALERDDSFGETDLYLSMLMPDSTWTQPMHLGREVNSEQFESGPTFDPNGSTLYFSSNLNGGLGGYDLYSTEMQDAMPMWTKAKNLGGKINSASNDQFLVMAPEGLRALFSSDRKGGKGHDDIYEAVLDQHDTGLYVLGTITDAVTKKPVIARFEFDLQPSNIKVAVDSSQASGRFFMQLPYLAKYEMRVTADNYFPITQIIGLSRYDEKRAVELELKLQPLKVGTVVDLEGINFETGSTTLTESSTPALKAVARLLIDNPHMRVEIGGHTDDIGDALANQMLSLKRAISVVNYLLGQGIHISRLHAKGYGETKPIKSNKTEEGREANRRVEFFVIEQ